MNTKKTKLELQQELAAAQKQIAELEAAANAQVVDDRCASTFHASPNQTALTDSNNSRYVEINGASQQSLGVKLNQAEDSLRTSEAYFRNVFETSADAIFIVDQETGEFVAANPSATQVYGYMIEEFLRMRVEDISLQPGESMAAIRNEDVHVPLRIHKRKDGSSFPVEITGSYFSQNGRRFHTVFIRDITERKRVEEKLRASEERYRNLVENMNDVIMEVDSQGNFCFISPNYQALSGYSVEQELHTSAFTHVHPDDVPMLIQTLQSGHLETDQSLVYRVQKSSGDWLWIETSGRTYQTETGETHMISVARDITDRKRAEEVLLKSEARLRIVLGASPIPMTVNSLDDGSVLYGNQALAEMFNTPLSEILGTKAANYYADPADRERALIELNRNGNLRNFETRLRLPNDNIRWVLLSTEKIELDGVSSLLSSFHDITEHKQAESQREAALEKLRESEEQNRFLLNNTSDFIARFDRNGTMVFGTEASLRFNGYPISEIINTSAFEHIHPDDQDNVRQEIKQVIETGIEGQVEYRLKHKNGETIWVEATGRRVMKTAGEPEIVVVQRNITERKRAEEAHIKSELLLAEAQRVGRIGHWEWIAPGRIMQCSDEFFRILEIEHTGNTIPQSRIMEMMDVEDVERLRKEDQAAFAAGADLDYEYRIHLSGGHERWIHQIARVTYNEHGKPVRMVGIIQDVTERKQAESQREAALEKLCESEERHELVMEGSQLGYWDWDIETGNVNRNTHWAEMLGYTLEEVEATVKQWTDLHHPDDREAAWKSIQDHLDGKTPAHRIEYRMHAKDGQYKWILDQARVVKWDAQGKPLRMCGTHTDITQSKQAEERLRESEEKYRGLMETLDSVVATIDRDGKFLYMNEIAAKYLGGTPEALIGKTMQDLFLEPVASQQLEGVHWVIQEDKGQVSESLSFIHGQPRWFRNSLQPIHNEHGQVVHVLLHAIDIHELKTTQQELAELNRTLEERVVERTAQVQDLYDNAPSGYQSVDARGNIVNINQTELQWLGYTKDELLGKHITTIFPREIVEANLPVLMKEGQLHDLEFEIRRKDGSTIPVLLNAGAVYDKDGQFTASRGALIDITERKQAELVLQSSLKRVNALYQISQGAIEAENVKSVLKLVSDTLVQALAADRVNILMMDVRNRKIELTYKSGPGTDQVMDISFEEAWEGLSGWALREQKIAWSSMDTPDGRESPAVQKRRRETNVGDIIVVPLIYQGHALGTITAIDRPEGKGFNSEDVDLMQVIANQVAVAVESIRARSKLQRVNSELERAMRVKDEFLANMSHELRTPLNAIIGLSESMLEYISGDLNPRQQKYISTINESGQHLLTLINDVLDLAKIGAGQVTLEPSLVDVNTICQSSLRMIKQLSQKKTLQVQFDIDTDVEFITADERRLKQMIVNLLSNAVKFTPVNGQVGLEVRGDQTDQTVRFTVWDTGMGISKEDQARLFQPFVQVNSSLTRGTGGTGLGLALVAQMAKMHGGGVSLESEPGKGSRFSFILPWEKQPLPEVHAEKRLVTVEPSLIARSQATVQTILLVEDTEAVIMTTRDYLEYAGYRVEVARTGRDGIELAAQIKPDLILMDIQMPVMDGLTAIRLLRSEAGFKNTPIIALTAFAMSSDRERCLQAGATDYISKPVNLKALVKTIQKYCEREN